MQRALGVCYYPEHWDEAVWAEDAARMAAAGLTYVRIGEFAWSRMEPQPGQYDFGWLDRAIAVLGAAGLKVVLGTPTATPPRWMLDRHPDMLAVDADGRLRKFGSRRHYCFAHKGYIAECVRITEALARRYGANPAVAAWQTDNEYGCHDTTYSYGPSALAGFRDWLAQKYQSPDALNAAWGNVFWSMEYREFDEIELPNLTVTEANPAHHLDFRRFASDQVVAFNAAQVRAIRAHSSAPILHNFMGRIVEFDHWDVGADLDIATWDSYPLGFLEDRSDEGEAWKARFSQQGDPDFQAFHHDLYRAVGRGRMWIMEQQPGPVNWAPWNPAPLPGMVRLWSWEAFAHGAEVVSYFRWRQAPFAQEQMHSGLLRPDSAAAPGLAEARQVADELATMPDCAPAVARVALVFDYESAWAWTIQPQGRDFDYFRLVFDTYRALRRLGLSVDILPPDCADLSAYKLVLAPGLMRLRDNLRAALARFNGLALFGPRAGAKTADMAIPASLPPDIPGITQRISRVESLRPGATRALPEGAFLRWFEHLDGAGSVHLATQGGAPALVGEGNMRYLAGWPDAVAFRAILGELCVQAGLETHDLPEGVRLRDTASHRFFFNYTSAPVQVLGQSLPPAGVHWRPL